MLDLFVNHIVEDYPAIDYIAIKTKKGEEISLNWEESEYSWNDDQSVSGRLLKKQIPKDVHAELRNVYFDTEEEEHTIPDSVKRESLKGAEIAEIQIFIENFSGRKEDVGFWLQVHGMITHIMHLKFIMIKYYRNNFIKSNRERSNTLS